MQNLYFQQTSHSAGVSTLVVRVLRTVGGHVIYAVLRNDGDWQMGDSAYLNRIICIKFSTAIIWALGISANFRNAISMLPNSHTKIKQWLTLTPLTFESVAQKSEKKFHALNLCQSVSIKRTTQTLRWNKYLCSPRVGGEKDNETANVCVSAHVLVSFFFFFFFSCFVGSFRSYLF